MSAYVIGIDAGTTSIKGMLMDNNGNIITVSKQEYTLEISSDSFCELDAEIYWKITCQIIRGILLKSGIKSNYIRGISFSSQGETLIPVDSSGNPLRKAIVWLDNRSDKEAGEVRKKFGRQHIMNVTGQPDILPLYPATSILWLRKHEAHLFNQVEKYLLVEDYLIYRLTGRYCTEYSVVSSTLYFDIVHKKWWSEMLDFIGITENQLPELLESGTPVGSLTKEAAIATGLSIETKCVVGAYDHAASAIGSANIFEGNTTLTIGASMAMCVATSNPFNDLSLNVPCHCHALKGLYFLQPYSQTAGIVLKWFKDEFCRQEIEEADRTGIDVYDLITEQAMKVDVGSEGLIMLPHLMGAGSPEFNPKATGVFAGIKMGMSKGYFIRAIIESVCLMIYNNIMVMKEKGIEINNIHLLGGASKSKLWSQVLTDVIGISVVTLENSETSVAGACLLAGNGIGIYKSLEDACNISVKKSLTFEPDTKNNESYLTLYQKYLYLYKQLKSFWKL